MYHTRVYAHIFIAYLLKEHAASSRCLRWNDPEERPPRVEDDREHPRGQEASSPSRATRNIKP